MSTTADLRVLRPRHAHQLSQAVHDQLAASKIRRKRTRIHKKKETKRRLLTALKRRQNLETTRSRYMATTPPPVINPSDVHILDMLLAQKARASFGTPIVLNAN